MYKDKLIIQDDNYVKVYENCLIRKGWVITLQVSKDEWKNPRYDRYI